MSIKLLLATILLAISSSAISIFAAAVRPESPSHMLGKSLVSISEVSLQRFRYLDLADGKHKKTLHRYLVVKVYIYNASKKSLVHYKTWREGALIGRPAFIKDSLGNVYKLRPFDFGIKIKGQSKNAVDIYPNHEPQDVLVFERPVGAAKTLTLSLSGHNVGAKQMKTFKFKKPAIGHPIKFKL